MLSAVTCRCESFDVSEGELELSNMHRIATDREVWGNSEFQF